MRRGVVSLLFLLSGATALCYQVAWTRHLVLLFGNTSHAMALILAAYMLGLALGSEAGGRWADRVRRPALLYASLEAGIGAFALLFPLLERGVRAAYLGLGVAAPPVLFVFAFALLVVPTFLMGTTLPLLVRASVDRAETTGSTVGWLYGINTVGAVLGAGVTGFWLLENAGILGATYWSAGVNVLIGVLGVTLLRGAERPGATQPDEAPAAVEKSDAASVGMARAALVAVLCAGLVGLAAEVVWTRLLIFFLQGFTYTFTAMLVTFLAGLAIGGFVFGRVARRVLDPARALGVLQVTIGVAAAGVLLVLTHYLAVTQATSAWVESLLGQTRGTSPEDQIDLQVLQVAQLLAASALTLLPPAVLMGGVFPLAAAAYQRGIGDLGRRVGRLYAVNTVGAVLGSLGAGFVLVPLVGAPFTAAAIALLSVASGAAVLLLANGAARAWRVPALGALAAAALLVLADPSVPFLLRSHVFAGTRARENRLEETVQGTVCQVSVVRNERDDYTLLYTDEFQAAGTKPEYRYMRMLAHLPVALAEHPEKVLVICFGTGTTCGSVSTHDEVKQLDIVEISPEVLSVADRFRDVNRGVLDGAGRDDLDVRVHVDDGRNYVLRSRDTWDVITLEPLMPYTPAAIHFYTEDFYRECAPRLAPGGLMCQWIPLQGMSGEHFRMLVRAFVDVFPDSGMFFVDGAVALVGGPQPLTLDYDRVAASLSRKAVHADLAAVGYGDPVRALGTYVSGGAALVEFARSTTPITDEHPVLEFHPIPANKAMKHLWENLRHMLALRQALPRLPVTLTAQDGSAALEDRLHLALRCGNELIEGMVLFEQSVLFTRARMTEQAGMSLVDARSAFALAHSLDPQDPAALRNHEGIERVWCSIRARTALDAGDLEEAERQLLAAIEYPALRQDDAEYTTLATVRNRMEHFEDALAAALEATRRFPRGREALAERAYARGALGDLRGAARDYRLALSGDAADTLGPRLAADASRVLSVAGEDAEDEFEARLDAALEGVANARVPVRLALALLAQERPEAYARRFDGDFAVTRDAAAPEVKRALALERLRLAAPPGAVDAAVALLGEAGAPQVLIERAAQLVAERDAGRLAVELQGERGTAALAASAGVAHDRRVVDALAELLDHEDLSVRTRAQASLFALLGDAAPGLARLDPSALGTRAHRAAVGLIRSWWLRNRDAFGAAQR